MCREALADEIAISGGDVLQLAVNLGCERPPMLAQTAFAEFPAVMCATDLHAQAVVGEDFEFLDVVVGLPCHH